MPQLLGVLLDRPLVSAAVLLFTGWLTIAVTRLLTNLWRHPLAKFPGPRLAAATDNWHAFVECVLKRSFTDVLKRLHDKYGKSSISMRRGFLFANTSV